jgi:hypothetical protein
MLKHFKSSPLWLIGLFIIFAQGTAGVAAVQIEGWPQEVLVWFVVGYSSIVTTIFFAFLWWKPENFYGPSEYGDISPELYRNALRGLPSETAEAVRNLEENPLDQDALFRLMDNLLSEDVKQHLIFMRRNSNELDVSDTDDRGFSFSYEIITRGKGVSFGNFSRKKFMVTLSGTDLLTISGGGDRLYLSKRGQQFCDWLIEHKKDAETYQSSLGRWGKEQSAMDVMKSRFDDAKKIEKNVTPVDKDADT